MNVPRSSVDTRNWRRLVELCEANPGGVTIERDARGVFWHVRIPRREGVESAMSTEIDGALHCLADNLESRAREREAVSPLKEKAS